MVTATKPIRAALTAIRNEEIASEQEKLDFLQKNIDVVNKEFTEISESVKALQMETSDNLFKKVTKEARVEELNRQLEFKREMIEFLKSMLNESSNSMTKLKKSIDDMENSVSVDEIYNEEKAKENKAV